MIKEFYIYAAQRSGSSHLMHSLDDHPQIFCAGAIFRKTKSNSIKHPEHSFNMHERRKSRKYRWFKGSVINNHLNSLYQSEKQSSVGFRLMVNQAETTPTILKQLKKRNAVPVVLIRKNIVRQAISLTIAQNAGIWEEDETDGHKKIELDVNRLNKNIKYFQRSRSELEELASESNAIVVYFEDLINGHREQTLRDLYSKLGVLSEFKTRVSGIKTSKYELKDRISNINEVTNIITKQGLGDLITAS